MSDEEYLSEDEEISLDEDAYSGLKNIGIIIIDICPSMFDERRQIKKCLAAVYQQMDKMLLSAYRRDISVCLLRDDDVILTALSDNIVDSCKKILDLLQQPTEALKAKFERTSTPSLRYTFSECLKQVKNLQKINPHIIIMTNDDDPHKGDITENLSAIDVALSFKESNAKLIVLPLNEGFRYEAFYGGLLKAANDVPLDIINSEERVYDSVDDLNEILECVIKRTVRFQRLVFRLYNKEDQELTFWTQVHYLAKPNHLYHNCNISRATNNPIKQEYNNQSVGNMNKYVVYTSTGNTISIEKHDFPQMKMQMSIGILLLYLTPEKRSSVHYLVKKSLILQNDESTENKKQKLFDDLWHYCRQFQQYMICAYLGIGSRQVPAIVEFAPEVFQSKPCFVGHIFPDSEEIVSYTPEDERIQEIPENDRELQYLLEMIDKLTVKNFSPAKIPCYEYEAKAALLKGQLLDIDVPPVEDYFPSNDRVKDKLGETYNKLADIFVVVEEPKAKKPYNPRKKD